EGSWLHRALLRRAHRRRWSLGVELALNSGHLTAKPSALTRSAQPALGALNDSCVAIASPKGHARPFPEHPILERAEGTESGGVCASTGARGVEEGGGGDPTARSEVVWGQLEER